MIPGGSWNLPTEGYELGWYMQVGQDAENRRIGTQSR